MVFFPEPNRHLQSFLRDIINTKNPFVMCGDLVEASRHGHLDVVKFLIHIMNDSGADARANNDEALICASMSGHLEVVQFLIGVGADVHADSDGALMWALLYNHSDVAKLLILHGGRSRRVAR